MAARKSLPSDAKVLEFPLSSRDPDHVRDGGYVLIWRRLFEEGDSVLGTNRLLIGAWIELISLAAHKPIERRIGESWFHLQRGQLVISLHEIARNWGVPWTTFWRACKRMEASGRIRLDTVRVRSKVEPTRTMVTICNYDLYQNPVAHSEPTAVQGRTNPYNESKALKAGRDSDVTESPSDQLSEPSPAPQRPKSGAAGAHKRGSRLQADWKPDQAERAAAIRLGLPGHMIASTAEEFVDYWIAQPGQKGVKIDWPATWRNWCRTAVRRLSDSQRHQLRPKAKQFAYSNEDLARIGDPA